MSVPDMPLERGRDYNLTLEMQVNGGDATAVMADLGRFATTPQMSKGLSYQAKPLQMKAPLPVVIKVALMVTCRQSWRGGIRRTKSGVQPF